jgi:hypothetical protein
MPPSAIEARLAAARPRLLAAADPLGPDGVRAHDAWGWVHMTLHGHYLDHLLVIEPWAAQLRARQVDGDPFVEDPRAPDHAGFVAQDAEIEARFDDLVRAVPAEAWAAEVTPGWTLQDHVGHLADWATEAVRAIDVFRRRGHWLSDPEEGVDAWNETHVVAARGASPAETLARYEAARGDLLGAIERLSVDELRSPDGWSWAYDCLHGHVRKHLAMLGPWSRQRAWPAA